MENASDSGPVEEYFVGVVREVKTFCLRESNPSNVVEETLRKESLPGKRVVGSFDRTLDRHIKSLTRGLINSVADSVIREQRIVIAECAAKESRNELTQDEFHEYEDEFVGAVSPWISRLNSEARAKIKDAIRDGFRVLVDNISFFMRFEGRNFEEILENAPREQSQERLRNLVEYIGNLREAVVNSSEVYVEHDFDAHLVPSVRIHFRREAARLLDEVHDHVSERIEESITEAYS